MILFSILLFVHCTGNINENNEDDYLIEYQEKLNQFEKSLVDHFPQRIGDEISFTYSDGSDIFCKSLVLSCKRIENDSLLTFERFASDNSRTIYNAYDSCLIIVNRHLALGKDGLRNFEHDNLKRSKSCNSKYLPVPKFWDSEFDQSKPIHLTENYKLFVIAAESGIYSDDLHRLSGRNMPQNWKHGYSRGYAFSLIDSEILYWIIW
jgi:hypothetical protein